MIWSECEGGQKADRTELGGRCEYWLILYAVTEKVLSVLFQMRLLIEKMHDQLAPYADISDTQAARGENRTTIMAGPQVQVVHSLVGAVTS